MLRVTTIVKPPAQRQRAVVSPGQDVAGVAFHATQRVFLFFGTAGLNAVTCLLPRRYRVAEYMLPAVKRNLRKQFPALLSIRHG